jgi:hypothetical protein
MLQTSSCQWHGLTDVSARIGIGIGIGIGVIERHLSHGRSSIRISPRCEIAITAKISQA